MFSKVILNLLWFLDPQPLVFLMNRFNISTLLPMVTVILSSGQNHVMERQNLLT